MINLFQLISYLRLHIEGKVSLSDLDLIYKHEVLRCYEITFWNYQFLDSGHQSHIVVTMLAREGYRGGPAEIEFKIPQVIL